jgi:hypothetical protein
MRLAVPLCLLLAAPLGSAPAPFLSSSRVWTVGWDAPEDAVGDCVFEKRGDRLTLTIPRRRDRADSGEKLTEVRMLRVVDVEGDFQIQVRVKGETLTSNGKDGCFDWSAGLVLTDGEAVYRVMRWGYPAKGKTEYGVGYGWHLGRRWQVENERLLQTPKPAYLRFRVGKDVSAECSEDGKTWTGGPDLDVGRLAFGKRVLPGPVFQPLERGKKIKAGILIRSREAGGIRVEFDEFEVTPLPKGER